MINTPQELFQLLKGQKNPAEFIDSWSRETAKAYFKVLRTNYRRLNCPDNVKDYISLTKLSESPDTLKQYIKNWYSFELAD